MYQQSLRALLTMRESLYQSLYQPCTGVTLDDTHERWRGVPPMRVAGVCRWIPHRGPLFMHARIGAIAGGRLEPRGAHETGRRGVDQ
jgi:hypothetical protein